MNDKRTAMV